MIVEDAISGVEAGRAGRFGLVVGVDREGHADALLQHGADVIVMGCAGMAGYRAELQAAVGLPVVEPTQAAVGMAIARVATGW